MKLEPDYWLELEKNYFTTLLARQELLKKHRDRVFFHEPESEFACRELMEVLVQYICKRYPQYFSLEQDNNVLHNRLLQTRTDLKATHPLTVIFEHIPEDYALMMRNSTDGLYYLRAAAVCSSVGWDIAQQRNRPLSEIHATVPDYAAKMGHSMDRFFARMPTDKPIQRCSWSLEDWAPLFSSPEIEKDWKRSAFAANPEDLKINDIRLRCDWQTLRRLPLSGAIVFNFKAVTTALTELREEAYVPALLSQVLRQGKPELVSYKSLGHVKELAVDALEQWAKEQVAAGVVPENWEPRTLDESPFYPGWEGKWHAKQGF